MNQTVHEEFEVGSHVDQALRAAMTAIAQTAERLARSGAASDRAAAQALRELTLRGGRVGAGDPGEGLRRTGRWTEEELFSVKAPDGPGYPSTKPVQAGDYRRREPAPRADAAVRDLSPRAEAYLVSQTEGGAQGVSLAWADALADLSADPRHTEVAQAARELRDHARSTYGLDLAGAGAGDRAAGEGDDVDGRQRKRLSAASGDNPMPAVWRSPGGVDYPVLAVGRAGGPDEIPRLVVGGGAELAEAEIVGATRAELGYDPVWSTPDGEVDRSLFDPLVGHGFAGAQRTQPDRAAAAAAVTTDVAAAGSDRAVEAAAVAHAADEVRMIMLPERAANTDRGVRPSQALTPEEATHRRQAWTLARRGWDQSQSEAGLASSDAAWNAMEMTAKTELYWDVYHSQEARLVPTRSAGGGDAGGRAPAQGATPVVTTVGGALRPPVVLTNSTDRGMAPTKAATAQERERRTQAWAAAEASFKSELGPQVSKADAAGAWKNLDWPDRTLAYWKEYDGPAASGPAAAATPQAGAPTETAQTAAVTQGAAPVGAPAGRRAGKVAVEATGVPLTRERVIELNEQAQHYFEAQMPGSKGGGYLEERLGKGVVVDARYGLGYAPPGWTNLTNHLRQNGATTEEIVGAGLGRMSDRGSVIDVFRDRAMVAVRSEAGETVGFVGRDLSGHAAAPKYTNTRATAAFTKGDHLLGLHEARSTSRLVRVEGPFDAIAVTAAGNGEYAGVSPMGTALTQTQADTLARRSGGRVWESLDTDYAGVKASESDYWLLRDRDVDVRRIVLPSLSDPAQVWAEDPGHLVEALRSGESAPPAALGVIDSAIARLATRLAAGDADAFEEISALEDQVKEGMSEGDRLLVTTYTTAEIEDAAAQPEADDMNYDPDDERDERWHEEEDAGHDLAPQARDASAVHNGVKDHLAVGVERSETFAVTTDGRAGAVVVPAQERGGTTAPRSNGGTAPRYDRAATGAVPAVALTAGVAAEAVSARSSSAPGFSQPTRSMLNEASTGQTGTAARRTTQETAQRGVTREHKL